MQIKIKFKLLFCNLKQVMFGREPSLDLNEILNPPSWLERQIQNETIDRRYKESLRIEPKSQEHSWADKYK